MGKFLFFLIISSFFLVPRLEAQISETHEFGETSVYYYVYSDGKTWDFTAENNMTVETIEIKSVLASSGGTFHIQIRIEGNLVASWDQYVNSTTFHDYFHSKTVSVELHEGDEIEYKIYGGSFSTPVGGIRGINYVKLTGGGGGGYDLQFSSLSDMIDARYGLGYTSDGDNIYAVCGGLSTHPYKSTRIEKYNIATNAWEYASGLIPKKYCNAEYVPGLDKIYVFNGETYSGTSYTDTIEIIDPTEGTLSYKTSNPYPVEYAGSAVWNKKIYVFGGSNGDGYSKRFYEYNPLTDSWVRLPDMAEAKQTNGEIVNGVLYVIGGYNGTQSNRIDAYDIQTATWTYLATLEVSISAHAVTRSGTLIWIVGSYDNINFIAVYDTESNEFIQLSSNMTGRRHCGAVVHEQNLYIFGGNQTSSALTSLSSLEMADISNFTFGLAETPISQMIPSHNYPNPFTQSTQIVFSLQENVNTTVIVYDQRGKVVKLLFDGYLSKGEHQLEFDGRDLAGGMYFYTILSGKSTAKGKLMLIK